MKVIGVDVGGTFTDFHIMDLEGGGDRVFKRPSTPDNPADAIIEGLKTLVAEGEVDASEIRRICHGTTVATNALIQRKGGTVALVTTEGFRDLLEIGRQTRPHMYDVNLDHPAPLVERQLRLTAAERVDARGQVLRDLDDADVSRLVEQFVADGVKSCAVCLLFSFLNPEHERKIGAALEAAGISTSLSCEVQPEFREYERMSTTVLNAYLVPVMNHYLAKLEQALSEDLPEASVGINQSSGGLMSIRQARRFPVRTALSGPAGGVIGAAHIARLAGREDVITLDMGGTSADVCMIESELAGVAFDRSIGGFPVRLPMVDVNAVGAGGGSIVWFDRGGMLQVGPYSAGAKPGPACYGLGGTEPTVTDANVVLGRLDKDNFLGGEMSLDVAGAEKVVGEIAQTLGLGIDEAAVGIITVLNSNMANAIRSRTVQKGIDPRDFSLMAFGGAGPLHGAEVADMLGVPEVIVPAYPGITSALGLLASELKYDSIRTQFQVSNALNIDRLNADFLQMEEDINRQFDADSVAAADVTVLRFADARYIGQGYELRVDIDGGTIDAASMERTFEQFHRIHEAEYGHTFPQSPIEIVNIRVTGTAPSPQLEWPKTKEGGSRDKALVKTAKTKFRVDGALQSFDTAFYRRADLPVGSAIAGPAIILQLDTTTVVPPNWSFTADPHGNLILTAGVVS